MYVFSPLGRRGQSSEGGTLPETLLKLERWKGEVMSLLSAPLVSLNITYIPISCMIDVSMWRAMYMGVLDNGTIDR